MLKLMVQLTRPDAKVFDISADEEQNILHREAIHNELKSEMF